MYAKKDGYFCRLDTAPDGTIYRSFGNKSLQLAVSDLDTQDEYASTKQLEEEGFEIIRDMDGLSVGDVVNDMTNNTDYTVIHRSGYGDMSLVLLAHKNGTARTISFTLKQIKESCTLKLPVPEKCVTCGK